MFLCAFLLCAAASAAPNVVVIVADDLGYNDIGYNNQDGEISTPFLDSLSEQGVRMSRFYGASMCSPARAALVTGRYPFREGLQGAKAIPSGATMGLPSSSTPLLPEAMKEAGYDTYLVGKWHLGFSSWKQAPTGRGFNYFYGLSGHGFDYFTHMNSPSKQRSRDGSSRVTRNAASTFDLSEHRLLDSGKINETGAEELLRGTWGVHAERLFSSRASQIIRTHDVTSKPLFLMVCYTNPHSPLQVLDEDLEKVPAGITNNRRRLLSGLVVSLDHGVKEIVTALKDRGIYENTLVVFVGDNGPSMMGGSAAPLRGGKTTIWEGGVRIPAFVVGPGIKSNVTSHDLYHMSDVYPTIAGLVGIPYTGGRDGVDQSGNLRVGSTSPAPRREVIVDLDRSLERSAIIQHEYKLIVGDPELREADINSPPVSLRNLTSLPFSSAQLYNLVEDPGESRDLYSASSTKKNSAIALFLYFRLIQYATGDVREPLVFQRRMERAVETVDLSAEFQGMTQVKRLRPWLD